MKKIISHDRVFLAPWIIIILSGCSSDADNGYQHDYGTDYIADEAGVPDSAYEPNYDVPQYEPVDTLGLDRDGDGYTIGQGDCDDSLPQVNPGAYEHAGNSVDDDCDTIVDNPLTGCDCGTDDLVSGFDLCDRRFLLNWFRNTYTSRAQTQGAAVRTGYGSPGNGLAVRQGCSYTILATGAVDLELCDDGRQIGTDFYGNPLWSPCPPGAEPEPNPSGVSDGALICDTQQLVLNFKAPPNANGFSFDFAYLSVEYPEWVDEGFNDTFYAIFLDKLTGTAQNISFDNSGMEIEVDNAFFEDPPVTSLAGTGYEITCLNENMTTTVCGSSTGWLRTSWNIQPGQEFDLTFSIHDEGDGIYDSAVILDNFQWSPVPVEPGTVPII